MCFCFPTYQQTKGGKLKKMNNFRRIKKNAKALSPVVASIILIAVTVAVSVVVAAWMGGMTTGLMGNAEQGSITNVEYAGDSIVVTVQNTGKSQMTLNAAYINGTTYEPEEDFLAIAAGHSASYTLDNPSATALWASGDYFNIKFTTTHANNIVYSETYP